MNSGGTLLHELPEFMLPTALHILAHHPDYPTPEVPLQPCQTRRVSSIANLRHGAASLATLSTVRLRTACD